MAFAHGASQAAPAAPAGVAPRADLAFAALAALPIGVALIDETSGALLLSTPIFDAFRAEGDIVSDSAPADPSAPREVRLADGRTFRILRQHLAGALLVTVEDVSEEAADRLRLASEARREPMTGLANRMALQERLSAVLTQLRPGETVAVLCLDLDRFKAINDTLGHAVGDALLRTVADRLRSASRKDDIIARLGGDEFAIVQIGQEQPNAAGALAARLVDLVGRSYVLEGHLLNVGASVGVAVAPADGATPERLLKNADLALYRAKEEGRGTYRFFEQAMDEQMQARRSMELELRRVIALRQLELVYQPQFNIADRRVTGFEALLRWRHPERGVVSPADFIPLAEETGLIVPIGEWVIRTACEEAARWPAPLSVAVNVSAVQFTSRNLVPTVMSALATSGLAPDRLEIEITESVVLRDSKGAVEILHALRDLGVKVSMDDFGTGYSSLSYLRKFPFDTIKIDQSFVRGSGSEESGAAIVRAIAAIGRSLGMATIAEGVETEEQLGRITADGCTAAQGYFISKPLPTDQITSFLADNGIARAPAILTP